MCIRDRYKSTPTHCLQVELWDDWHQSVSGKRKDCVQSVWLFRLSSRQEGDLVTEDFLHQRGNWLIEVSWKWLLNWLAWCVCVGSNKRGRTFLHAEHNRNGTRQSQFNIKWVQTSNGYATAVGQMQRFYSAAHRYDFNGGGMVEVGTG